MTNHIILFTGHMIDASGRKQPRFPADKEAAASGKIKAALQQVISHQSGTLQGVAGAACGGDILFQETCIALNIPSQIYLTLPPEEYKKTSVSFAGKNWESRFDALVYQLPVHLLPEAEKEGKNIWEATNEWMLQETMNGGGGNTTLIALWNGEGGDGPGGTQHMIEVVKANGGEVVIISTQKL